MVREVRIKTRVIKRNKSSWIYVKFIKTTLVSSIYPAKLVRKGTFYTIRE